MAGNIDKTKTGVKEQITPIYTDKLLPIGLSVKRKSDGVTGVIERFGRRFVVGAASFNAYYVRWSDGKLGYPNESDFEHE